MTFFLSNGTEQFGPYDDATIRKWTAEQASVEGWWIWEGTAWKSVAEWSGAAAAPPEESIPVTAPESALTRIKPKMKPYKMVQNPDWEYVLLPENSPEFLILDRDQLGIVPELNGEQSLDTLLRQQFEARQLTSGTQLYNLLVALYNADLLLFKDRDEESAFVRAVLTPTAANRVRKAARKLTFPWKIAASQTGLPVPFARFFGRLLANRAGRVWSVCAVLVTLLFFPIDPEIDPFAIADSPFRALLAHFITLSVLLTARSILRGGAAAAAGEAPRYWYLAVTPVAVFLDFHYSELYRISRSARRRIALGSLLFPFTVTALAVAGMILDIGFTWWYRAGLDALALFLFSLRPFGESAFMRWSETFGEWDHIRNHARAFLRRNFLRRLFAFGGEIPQEAFMLTFSTFTVAWLYVIFIVGSRLFDAALLGLVSAAASPVSIEPVMRVLDRISAGYFLALLIAALSFGLVRQYSLLMQNIPASFVERFRRKNRETADIDPDEPLLAQHPLFSNLLPRERAGLIAEMRREHWRRGTPIIRQGTEGDRFFLVLKGRLEVVREHPSGLIEPLAELGSGDAFGELALLHNAPRSATVRAKTRCELAAMTRETFRAWLERHPEMAERMNETLRAVSVVQGIPALKALSAEQVSQVVSRLVLQPARAGEVIIEEGTAGDAFFIVREGVYVVSKRGRKVATVKPPAIFGEVALMLNRPRTARVQAQSDGLLYRLDGEYFRSLIYASLGFNVALEQTVLVRKDA